MTRMDIEEIAVQRVKREILKYDCLKDFINSNDKMPLWDGEIFIYEENCKYQQNEKLVGRIGVQVKGHKVKKLKNGNSKYSIEVEYLRAYQKEKRGTLLFVVEIIDSENTQIYYANLLPVDLKEILEKVKENQKTVTINIKPIKEKSPSSIKMICQNFLKNSNEQMNIEIKNIDEIKDIKEINFTIIGEKQYLEEYMLTNDVYTYGIDKASNQKFALPKLTKIQSFKTIKSDVQIKGKEYYNEITIFKNKDEEYFLLGKATKIYINKNKVNFHVCGNLYDRIKDINFILDLLRNNEIKVKNQVLPMKVNIEKGAKEKYIKSLEEDLKGLEIIKKISEKFHIRFDIDIEKLDKDGWHNLERFIKLNNGIKINGIEDSNIHFIDIDKYCIAFLILYDDDKKIKVYNYFEDLSDKIKVFYLNEKNEQVVISPYVNLTAENLVKFSNIDIEVIKSTFEEDTYTKETCERYNLWLLEVIKAYDITGDKKWFDFAKYLNDKILNNSRIATYIVNQKQIIKRLRDLTIKEKEELYQIKEKEEDNMMLCAISILLENWSDYERYFNKLSEEEKKQFIGFPIYHLKK